jgi:hypothetical protein
MISAQAALAQTIGVWSIIEVLVDNAHAAQLWVPKSHVPWFY